MSQPVLLGSSDPDVARLAAALGVAVTPVFGVPADPGVSGDLGVSGDPGAAHDLGAPGDAAWPWAGDLDHWREGALAQEMSQQGTKAGAREGTRPKWPRRPAQLVVAVWVPVREPMAVIDLDLATWVAEVEAPLAGWVAALGVAARVVADGGTVVAVAERPSPLDCAGHGPETAVADAVEAMVRSLARSEGPRGVRVNMVTTPARIAPEHPVAPPPPLATFPGTVELDGAGAVRMLLGADAAGLTGTVVHADAGRSWR